MSDTKNNEPTVVSAQHVATERILQRCDALAKLSAIPNGICRTYLGAEHQAANQLVAEWMEAAGMTVTIDGAGSICGRLGTQDPDAPTLLLGSHLDSIPDAGRFDGILGVLMGIEAAQALQSTALPFAIDVLGFAEEEGVRFGTTLMTSRACAGTWDDTWLALTDSDGITLASALEAFGLSPNGINERCSRADEKLVGYLEAHIEQGPVLESLGLPLAVVSSIAGAKRLEVVIDGMAAHAGTMPMNMRQDALAAAARAVTAIEDAANAHGVVATVGQIQCEPGGVNVVPGRCTFSIDIRAGADQARDAALDAALVQITQICTARDLKLTVTPLHAASGAACATVLQDAIAKGIAHTGTAIHTMESGAGHDAMALAEICPVGMLFIRCTGGISHHPDEHVTASDVRYALAAFIETIQQLARSRQ
ncbi:MAG: allantoate amidohydrolase [Pseudomonadales bacterium]